jgi:hypothetical protein
MLMRAARVMNQHEIERNPLTDEWFCMRCLRTSDHLSKADAKLELSQFECVEPKERK